MSRHSRTDDQLAALYAQVPDLPGCDGRCWWSCEPPEMSDREAQRLPQATRPGSLCGLLTAEGRCGDYEHRPMICRLWGTNENMPCPYGCRPTSRYLTSEQEFELTVLSLQAGGAARVGWPRDFDPVKVMAAYRANMNATRTRHEAGRAQARQATASRAAQDQPTPGHRPATTDPSPGPDPRPAEPTP
jgi:uncharacterized protein